MSSYYDILGVAPTASVDEIRKSYRRLALRWHPDKNQNNLAEATRRFREISEAYEVLSDAERRSVYDANRSNRRSDFEWPSTFVFRDPQEIFRDFFTFFDELDPLSSTYHEHDFHHTNVFSSTSTSDEDEFDESTIFPDVPYKRTMMVGMLQFFLYGYFSSISLITEYLINRHQRESRSVAYQNGKKIEKHSVFRNGHEVEEIRINDMLVSRVIDGVEQELPELPATSSTSSGTRNSIMSQKPT